MSKSVRERKDACMTTFHHVETRRKSLSLMSSLSHVFDHSCTVEQGGGQRTMAELVGDTS